MKVPLTLLAFLAMPCLSASQRPPENAAVETKTLYICRFERIGQEDKDTFNLDSIVPATLVDLIKESKKCLIGPVFVNALKKIDKEKECYSLTAHYLVDPTTVYIRGKVKCMGKVEFYVHAQEHHIREKRNPFKKIEDALAEQIFKDVIIGMEKKIRVGITDFPVAEKSGRITHYQSALPNILGTYLNVSPELTIVEGRIAEISRELDKRERNLEFDMRTAVERGRFMMVNYLIMGQCWQEGAKLRIDVRCVSVEDAEVIASKGVTASSLDIEEIEREVKVLASLFRNSIIENVHKGKEAKVKSLVVLGLPPFPGTETNKKLTGYIVEAAVRKLIKASQNDSIWVKEAHRISQEDTIFSLDRMALAALMDADILFALRYQDYGSNDLILKADILDFEEPTKLRYNQIKPTTTKTLERTVDTIVYEALDPITNKAHNRANTIDKIKNIPLRRVTKTHGLGFTYGSIMTSSSGPLHYKSNSSFSLSAIFPVPGRFLGMHPDNFKIMTILTWDWGDGTLERLFLGENTWSVHQFSLILAGRYDFWPYDYFNIYLGTGIGVLWLRRIRNEKESFFHAPSENAGALAALLGADCRLTSHLHLTIPTKICVGIPGYSGSTYDNLVFNGGNFLGFNIGLGLFYKW